MSRGRSSVMFVGFAAMAAVACPLAAGCMAADGEDITSQDSFDVPMTALTGGGDPEEPPIGHNPFYPICFWNHGTQQTYRDLAGGALANTQGQLPAMSALPTGGSGPNSCKNQALKYLIQCALPQGDSVTDPATGEIYDGWYGIAPSWKTQALASAAKPWMTSCLLQHLNGYETRVSLLLEGHLSGFYQDPALQSAYPIHDSIAWGNLFNATPSGPFAAHVCYADDLQNACNDATNVVHRRMCGEDPDCNVVIEGRCDQVCTWDATGYWHCGAENGFQSRLKDLERYRNDCNSQP